MAKPGSVADGFAHRKALTLPGDLQRQVMPYILHGNAEVEIDNIRVPLRRDAAAEL